MRSLQCPKCSIALNEFETDSRITLDLCPQCKGIWFDRGELAKTCGASQDIPDEAYSFRTLELTAYACATCNPKQQLYKMSYVAPISGRANNPTRPLEVEYCKFCQGIFLDFKELGTVKTLLQKPATPLAAPDPSRIPLASTKINRWALPASLALAALFKSLWITQIVLYFLVLIQIHEFGHTIMSWLSGFAAIPLSVFIPMAALTIHVGGQSFVVFALVNLALGLFAYWSNRQKCGYPATIAVVLMLASVKLMWLTPFSQLEFLIPYSGIGGEFVISTFLICSFYYRFPDKMRWDVFRFVFLFAGAAGFLNAYTQWHRISKHQEAMPMGAMLFGSDHGGGDLNRLIAAGWTQEQIIASYLKLGAICAIIIVAHYFWNWKASLNRPTAAQTAKY